LDFSSKAARGLVKLSRRGRAHSNEKEFYFQYCGGDKRGVAATGSRGFSIKRALVRFGAALFCAELSFRRTEPEFLER
jgi:hypothetical protein